MPLRLDVVTVLLLAVRAVKVLTSHKKMALSRPADATYNKKDSVFTVDVRNPDIRKTDLFEIRTQTSPVIRQF